MGQCKKLLQNGRTPCPIPKTANFSNFTFTHQPHSMTNKTWEYFQLNEPKIA